LIEFTNLAFRYGGGPFELKVPSLRLAAGEQAACIGPSGSGKTTLLHLAAGILLPDAGRVAFDGTEWKSSSDAQRRRVRITRIGLVFQEFELFEHLTVHENILLPYYVNPTLHVDESVATGLAELADAVGIADHLDRRPRELSHGERQRVALCRALITRPSLVLADEPTGNLDPDATARILTLLQMEARRRNATLLMVTHDHSLLASFDRVIDLAEAAA